MGNRLSSLGVSPYGYNSSNELTSTPNASYTYDNNGNTLTKAASGNTTNYTWDFENHLTSVVLPGNGGTATFKYDPLGRRIQKVFTQSSTTTTTNYVYDGYDTTEETDQSANVLARYARTRNVDEILAESRSGTTSYYQVDGLGSVTSLSNGSGSVAQTYTLDSFGKQTASSGSLTNPFLYTGREFDTETSLSYYRARYYDQSTGRFLTEDPMAYAGRTSIYNYVGENPTTYTDPSGNQAIYGNWCGPDWTGGLVEEYTPAHDRIYLPPQDNVDYTCMQHDKCYYRCRIDHPCNRGERQNCMRICDQALIRDEPDTAWGNIIRNGIRDWNKNPDPGTNAHCGCKTKGT